MASRTVNACSNCNNELAEGGGGTPLRCAVCRGATYCSAACQESHWPSHKSICMKSGTLQLIEAIRTNDSAAVTRLAETKRVLNGKVNYTPHPTEKFPNPPTLGGWTALHQCVREKNVEMIKILISHGANLEIKDVDGETPTFVACTAQHFEMVKVLLDAGADPNAIARDGWTCLMAAAGDGEYEMVEALLDAGARTASGGDMWGRSVLDISLAKSAGQGICVNDGETDEEVMARHRRVSLLLAAHAEGN